VEEIGFVAIQFGDDEDDKVMNERVIGYKKALAEANIPFRPHYLKIAICKPTTVDELLYSYAYELMKQLLKTSIRAVVSGNNHTAIGVYSCLKEHGIRIPADIAMITFDDDFWLRMISPSISAIAQPSEQLGKVAAKRLILRLTQQESSPVESFRLKARFIRRGSSENV
jgi:LacI family transcriptional regulator